MAALDPSCAAAYAAVFSDDDASTWCVLRHEGKKVSVAAKGVGGLDALTAEFKDDEICFCLLRLSKTDDGGDSKRVKFIYIVWVGENASAIKKGKVNEYKGSVGELFKGHHVQKALYDRKELVGLEAEIDALLKKAGGANYDMGNINSGVKAGQSASLKQQSKNFFEQKDKETEIKGIQFEKFTRADKGISACDLGNRTMTASTTEAKRNTNGYVAPTSGAQIERGVGGAAGVEASMQPLKRELDAISPPRAAAAPAAGPDGGAGGPGGRVGDLGGAGGAAGGDGGGPISPGPGAAAEAEAAAARTETLSTVEADDVLTDTDTGPSYDEGDGDAEEVEEIEGASDSSPHERAAALGKRDSLDLAGAGKGPEPQAPSPAAA